MDNHTAHNLYTIAFYNLENLFDIYDDPDTLDDDFTPEGNKRWTEKRYKRKLKRIAAIILQVGKDQTGFPPVAFGVAEVENRGVVNDLMTQLNKKGYNYDAVHYDSPDERGVEVAFFYRKPVFEVLGSETFPLLIYNTDGQRDYTRDMLLVQGALQGEKVFFIVNHWPSRRDGTDETEYKRIKAANQIHEIINEITVKAPEPKLIVMGDFNDDPVSTSIKSHLVNHIFYNPFESILAKGSGSLNHNGDWHLFDQLIISRNFFEDESLEYKEASIFRDHSITEWKGKRKGNPFRTYIGKYYQGGTSDHFPVYVILQVKEN